MRSGVRVRSFVRTEGTIDGRRGFTLIELLVVIAVIVILISMILPALGKSRQSARATACLSAVRQLGMGLAAYVNDNKGYYPGHHTWVGATYIVWPPRIRAYVGGQSSFFWCPSNGAEYKWVYRYDSTAKAEYGYEAGERRLTNTSGFSFGYNDWGVQEFTVPHLGLGGWIGHKQFGETKDSRVLFPSEMVALADSKSDFNWDTALDPSDGVDAEYPSKRHFDGANVVFADGHARLEKQRDLVAPTLQARRRWNNDGLPHQEYW